MDGLVKILESKKGENEFSFKNLFTPLTTAKVITWIVIIGFVVYFNAIFNGFVWDDFIFIVSNPNAHVFNVINSFTPNLFNSVGYYRPIPALYFSSIYSIFGQEAFVYHFLQITLHIVNTCLIFIFFKKYFRIGLSFFLSLIFLIHPIQVESVSYIGAGQSELLFFFGISAFILCTRKNLSPLNILIISVLLLLTLLTKESGILFFIPILLYQFFFNRKKIFLVITFLSCTLIVYFLIRFGIGHVYFVTNTQSAIGRLSFDERLISIPSIFFYYIKTLFFPVNLAIDQQWTVNSINFSNFYMPLISSVSFITFLVILSKKVRKVDKKAFNIYFIFLISFLSGIFILLQFFPLDMTVADRWMYFPLFALLGATGIILQKFIPNKKSFNFALLIIAILIIIILSGRTMIRNLDWKDAYTLYSHDVKIEDNWDIQVNLGAEYVRLGQYQNAINSLKKSIADFPYETNYANLATVYDKMGRLKEANEAYAKALTLKKTDIPGIPPHASQTYINYILFLFKLNDYSKAVNISNMALNEYSEDYRFWVFLAYAEYNLNNQEKALSAATQMIKLKRDDSTIKIYDSISSHKPLTINFGSN